MTRACPTCGYRLSRYNPGPLCHSCETGRREQRRLGIAAAHAVAVESTEDGVVRLLREHGGMRCSPLAKELGVTRNTMHSRLGRLVEAGVILVDRDYHDGFLYRLPAESVAA